MPLDPKTHAELILDPAAFLAARGLDPEVHFLDHHGRLKPLVVRHSDGRPVGQVEDDGSIGPYVQKPVAGAPAVKIEYQPAADPATFSNA